MQATIEAPRTASVSPLPLGPLQEAGLMSAGLDYYKPTMSQLVYEQEPETEITFTFKNRGEQRLLDYVESDALQARLDGLRERGWQEVELDYLAGLTDSSGQPVFAKSYLDYLRRAKLPAVKLRYDNETDDLALETTGSWAMTTFWETIVMSEVNEMYFENYLTAHGLNPFDVYDEGDRRLNEKIAILRANPRIKFADFGTRRHFSLRWQEHVLERVLAEAPGNLIGTSNIALAQKYSVRPIGTFAHEMPMAYAGLAEARHSDIRGSHNHFLRDWYDRYGADLSTALTDTFGTEFFFGDFTPQQAAAWRGVRHDSGDPVAFGERLIKFYESNGIDPRQKTAVFSDGLDIGRIVELQRYFEDRVGVLFGWGTTLTNDLGIKPLNVVMKATHIRLADGRQADTVKLSDEPGKHTGPSDKVATYQHVFGP